MTADVLVVGAGPAGSIAALVLARAGARVHLVDRERFPREKLCGDTLNPGALAILDRLGVADRVRARALPIAGMVVTGPGGTRVVGEYGGGVRGAAILRRDLDLLLVEEAVRAGVVFEPGVMARAPLVADGTGRVIGIRTKGRDLRAAVVIAADGRRSRLAFDLGVASFAPWPRRWAFGTYYTDVDGATTHGEMHIREDRYVGVAAVPGGLTNVCVVCEMAGRRRSHLRPAELVHRAVAGDAALRERFGRARRAAPVSVLGPLAVETAAAGMPGLLLAGDAAGFIDPMTGDGLRFAMRGAELAAAAAWRELETGRPMHVELAAARRQEFRAKWRVNRVLRALVGSPPAVRLAARLAATWPAPIRALILQAGDLAVA